MQRPLRDWLGLTYGEVGPVPSDPDWPDAFRRLAADVVGPLGELVVAVEHVGSTAVPGLVAKPILDVAVGYGDRQWLRYLKLRDRLRTRRCVGRSLSGCSTADLTGEAGGGSRGQ